MLLPGFDPAKEPKHITEMRSIQTALRSNQQRPGYSTFACTGHKWEDDYLYHSCRCTATDRIPSGTIQMQMLESLCSCS